MRERDPVHDILNAWAEDTVERNLHLGTRPLLQVDIIPLFSGWIRARQSLEAPVTAYDFVTSVTAQEAAHDAWKANAHAAGDFYADIDALPSERYLHFLEANGVRSPYTLTRHLFLDGRPDLNTLVGGVEVSLIEALGHAAYNSSSGMEYIAVFPETGIPKDNPNGFLGFAGPKLTTAIKSL